MGLRGQLSGAIALAICLAAPALAETANGVGTQFELAFWQSVTGSDDPAVYEAYLQQYPAGTFSALAKAKVVNLRKGAEAAIAPAKEVPVLVMRGHAAAVSETAVPAVTEPSSKAVRLAYDTAQMPDSAPPATDDAALLEELARSQEVGGTSVKLAVAQGFALPARPVMSDVPELPLPALFCSADQRNDFHETRYKPVMDIARGNNAAAVAHMQRLQQVYDSLQMARDPTPMNAVAHEASAYQQVAAQAYDRQMAMVQQFQAIMAVPVTACQMVAAK